MKYFFKNKILSNSGFTFLEVLISISLIGILSSLVYVNINTQGRFQNSRNDQRISDIHKLMQAIKLHKSENNLNFLKEISDLTKNLYYQIGTGSQCDDICSDPDLSLEIGCVDLTSLVTGGFIPEIPKDPKVLIGTDEKTKYYISVNDYNVITLGSCVEELGINPVVPQITISN